MSPRTLSVCALIAACTAACGIENELQYTSTLEASTHGVVLSEDGLDGTAGMVGMTCTIDTSFGCPTEDIDLPTEEEEVVDHYDGRTLGRSDLGLHTIDREGYDASLDVAGEQIRAAAFAYDGAMWLAGRPETGCALHLPDGTVVDGLDPVACRRDADVAVDRSGAFFVSSAGVTQRVDHDGSAVLAAAGELVAWDDALGLLYTADAGGEELWALTREGKERWRVKVRHPVLQIAARGTRGQVLVRLERKDDTLLERRDGRTGELLGRSQLGEEDGDIVVSENGRTLGFVQRDRVSFFRLATDAQDDEVVDETPADCIEAGSRVSRD